MKHLALATILAFTIPIAPAHAGPDTAKLAQSRIDAAAKAYASAYALFPSARVPLEDVHTWSVRWLEAVIEPPGKAAAVKQGLADHVARMTDVEKVVADGFKAGLRSTSDVDAATFFRIEAELWQARGKTH
jgi:hypothetical protein